MSERENRRIILRTNLENEILVFEVEDNGVGMEYEVKQKVFTTFFTTKGGEGTGLGLLTTRRIVQEHGGTIDFESIKAKGSIFRMEFPLKRLPKPGFTCRDRTLFCPHINECQVQLCCQVSSLDRYFARSHAPAWERKSGMRRVQKIPGFFRAGLIISRL